jgi:cytochrome P450
MSQYPDYTPAHVPQALVFPFDHQDDPLFESAGGIPEAMAELSRTAPEVFWSPKVGGFWCVTGYDAVIDAGKRTDLFTSTDMIIPAGGQLVVPLMPLMLDPPNHAPMRKPLTEAFTPTMMMHRQEDIRALAADLLDKVAPLGKCDFFASVAEPMPVLIFMKIMGLDLARYREFRDLASTALNGTIPREEKQNNGRQVAMIMHELIQKRMAKREDDLMSRLIDLKVDGRAVTPDELMGYSLLLFYAGLDTVANMMAFSTRCLAKNQKLQQALRDDPSKIPLAVEDMLRRHAVAPVGRTVTKDVEWRGVQMRAGDKLLICYPAAGLDEKVYPDASEIKFDRPSYNHQAFGAGPHRCVGRHLARIELNVLFEELFKRIPTFRADPSAGKEKMHGGMVFGMDYLPLIWTQEAQH